MLFNMELKIKPLFDVPSSSSLSQDKLKQIDRNRKALKKLKLPVRVKKLLELAGELNGHIMTINLVPITDKQCQKRLDRVNEIIAAVTSLLGG